MTEFYRMKNLVNLIDLLDIDFLLENISLFYGYTQEDSYIQLNEAYEYISKNPVYDL